MLVVGDHAWKPSASNTQRTALAPRGRGGSHCTTEDLSIYNRKELVKFAGLYCAEGQLSGCQSVD
jgi:hypothetical protein